MNKQNKNIILGLSTIVLGTNFCCTPNVTIAPVKNNHTKTLKESVRIDDASKAAIEDLKKEIEKTNNDIEYQKLLSGTLKEDMEKNYSEFENNRDEQRAINEEFEKRMGKTDYQMVVFEGIVKGIEQKVDDLDNTITMIDKNLLSLDKEQKDSVAKFSEDIKDLEDRMNKASVADKKQYEEKLNKLKKEQQKKFEKEEERRLKLVKTMERSLKSVNQQLKSKLDHLGTETDSKIKKVIADFAGDAVERDLKVATIEDKLNILEKNTKVRSDICRSLFDLANMDKIMELEKNILLIFKYNNKASNPLSFIATFPIQASISYIVNKDKYKNTNAFMGNNSEVQMKKFVSDLCKSIKSNYRNYIIGLEKEAQKEKEYAQALINELLDKSKQGTLKGTPEYEIY